MDIQFVSGVATVIASMYGMLKFILKDTHGRLELLEKQHQEFKEEMRLIHRKFDAAQKKFDAMDNRLDGL